MQDQKFLRPAVAAREVFGDGPDIPNTGALRRAGVKMYRFLGKDWTTVADIRAAVEAGAMAPKRAEAPRPSIPADAEARAAAARAQAAIDDLRSAQAIRS